MKKILSAIVVAGAVSLTAMGLIPASQAAKPVGQVVVIQAVPGTSMDVFIDGESVEQGVDVGAVLGPFDLAPGSHEVGFSDASGLATAATLEVAAGSSSDVVIHLPADVGGEPVVNTYATPRKPIGPGKARVLIAHTATVTPADVRVDGQVVFTNIANGEYAEADVPAGAHRVELLPTGVTTDPILGPLDVTLAPRSLTMVYAVGSPTDQSMNVIVHTARLTPDGSTIPDTIDTGSAGLAADVRVSPFSTPGRPAEPGSGFTVLWLGGALGAIIVAVAVRRARRRSELQ